jgi:hypothetical protein
MCMCVCVCMCVFVQEELGSPALAFTRVLCAILALDARVADEVRVWRTHHVHHVHHRISVVLID